MGKYTASQKDEMLKHLMDSVFVSDTRENNDILNILMADKYVQCIIQPIQWKAQYHITEIGKKFILEGGYTEQRKKKIKSDIIRIVVLLITAIPTWIGVLRCTPDSTAGHVASEKHVEATGSIEKQ